MPAPTQSRATRIPSQLLLPLLLGLGVLGACGSGAEEERPRNLLWLVWDTTRADHLPPYGYGRATAPTLDRLAGEGAVFERAYAHSSLTPVSAGAFLSGTLPPTHGVRSLFNVGAESLNEGVPFLPEVLQQAGMRTGGFVSAVPMSRRYGFARGFDTFQDNIASAPGGCGNEWQRRADVTTELALDWLGEGDERPFFLFVHFFDVHDATLAPPKAFLEDRVSFPVPPNAGDPCALHGRLTDAQKVELYDAEIAFMDRQMQRLLERLDRLGALEETLVMVTADHGESLGQHDFWTHGLLYQEQLRVPLVMAGPGVPKGARVSELVRLADLPLTLAEIFDVAYPMTPGQVGESLVPFLRGETGPERSVYAEVHHGEKDRLKREFEMYSLRRGKWKLIHRPVSGRHELYDLEADPTELTNLWSADHAVAKALALELQSAADGRSAPEASEDFSDVLRALGYGEDGEALSWEELTEEERLYLEAIHYVEASEGDEH